MQRCWRHRPHGGGENCELSLTRRRLGHETSYNFLGPEGYTSSSATSSTHYSVAGNLSLSTVVVERLDAMLIFPSIIVTGDDHLCAAITCLFEQSMAMYAIRAHLPAPPTGLSLFMLLLVESSLKSELRVCLAPDAGLQKQNGTSEKGSPRREKTKRASACVLVALDEIVGLVRSGGISPDGYVRTWLAHRFLDR